MISFQGKIPVLGKHAHAFKGAQLIGDIITGANVGIWYNVTIRADMDRVTIGDGSNIQDNTVIHTDTNQPTNIGQNVTIGHSAIIHAATIHDNALIGMGAIILNKAVVESYAMVGAGSVVPPGKIVKSGTLWLGNPATYVRDLKPEEKTHIEENAKAYQTLLKQSM